MKKVVIVGGGPCGLFAAYKLIQAGIRVDLYDHSSGLGKKFLVAGNGGLNLTHSEDLSLFATRYGKDESLFTELLKEFSPNDLRKFCEELGVETFVGSSGRVFPKKLKAAEILLACTAKLKESPNFNLFNNFKLQSFDKKKLSFTQNGKTSEIEYDYVILALGGGSWAKTGSDGHWVSMFEKNEVKVNKLLPMNCGFERSWSKYFKDTVGQFPLKNISIRHKDRIVRGEVMLTPYGIEGGAIYALSNHIRDEILNKGKANIYLDLKPDLTVGKLNEKIAGKKDKSSLSNHLRKTLGIQKEVFILLKELEVKEFDTGLKELKIELVGLRPIDEAISTSGGVCFSELTPSFEITKFPKVFVGGEMLDFEAPTGGYLLQACFSTAFRITKEIIG